MHAHVWASRGPTQFSFNTKPMRLEKAEEYALALARAGHRYVKVTRSDLEAWADCGSFLTDDILLVLERP